MASSTFAAASFYTFAQSLQERWALDEAAVRTTISRAYYGALIEARDAECLSTRGPGGHQRVIDHYLAKGSPIHRLIARSLINLRDLRELADYEPKKQRNSREAFQAVQSAKKVIEALQLTPTAHPILVPKLAPPAAQIVNPPSANA